MFFCKFRIIICNLNLSISGLQIIYNKNISSFLPFYLQTTFIQVCKIRDESRGFGRLTRQSSLSSFHRKPYKFFNYIMVQSMRTVQMIEDERAERNSSILFALVICQSQAFKVK